MWQPFQVVGKKKEKRWWRREEKQRRTCWIYRSFGDPLEQLLEVALNVPPLCVLHTAAVFLDAENVHIWRKPLHTVVWFLFHILSSSFHRVPQGEEPPDYDSFVCTRVGHFSVSAHWWGSAGILGVGSPFYRRRDWDPSWVKTGWLAIQVIGPVHCDSCWMRQLFSSVDSLHGIWPWDVSGLTHGIVLHALWCHKQDHPCSCCLKEQIGRRIPPVGFSTLAPWIPNGRGEQSGRSMEQ